MQLPLEITRQLEAHRIVATRLGVPLKTAQRLFAIFNEVSLLRYEESFTVGIILFVAYADILPGLELKKRIRLEDTRAIRKLLEAGKKRYVLLAEDEEVYGMKDVKDALNKAIAPRVVFSKNSWQLISAAGETLLNVEGGLPRSNNSKFSRSSFYNYCGNVFPKAPLADLQLLYSLVDAVVKDTKGTNILITENAEDVVERLKGQCTSVKPFLLSTNWIKSLTGIDGTLIMDKKGNCHAFGAILDGLANGAGKSSRGGRYNSAVMYCNSTSHPCLLLVLSQDGTLDIINSKIHR